MAGLEGLTCADAEQQSRRVRGLMAAIYASHDAAPDKSLLQDLTEAKTTLRNLQRRRDA